MGPFKHFPPSYNKWLEMGEKLKNTAFFLACENLLSDTLILK